MLVASIRKQPYGLGRDLQSVTRKARSLLFPEWERIALGCVDLITTTPGLSLSEHATLDKAERVKESIANIFRKEQRRRILECTDAAFERTKKSMREYFGELSDEALCLLAYLDMFASRLANQIVGLIEDEFVGSISVRAESMEEGGRNTHDTGLRVKQEGSDVTDFESLVRLSPENIAYEISKMSQRDVHHILSTVPAELKERLDRELKSENINSEDLHRVLAEFAIQTKRELW